ncbi:MAG: hypothetical protein SGILL_003521 [Bacillariaceae sp.]
MLASLTAREPEGVLYLCRHLSFVSAVVEKIQNPVSPDQVPPLIEALGNIASHESMVPPLISQTNNPPLVPLLQNMLLHAPSSRAARNNGNQNGSHQTLNSSNNNGGILASTAWLCGCLLLDAGMDLHPSTTVAAKALIPALMERLGGAGTGDLSHDEEREIVNALWTGLSRPSQIERQEEQQRRKQQQIFGGATPLVNNGSAMFNFGPESLSSTAATNSKHPPPIKLPFKVVVPRSTLQALARMIKSSSTDPDTILSAVHVLDLLVRRSSSQEEYEYDYHQSLLQMMQEEDLPDALEEQVCDINDSSFEQAAEVAADLLDDFFYNT